MQANTTTTRPLGSSGATISHVRFIQIVGRATTDVGIEHAAEFFVRNYATHREVSYQWSHMYGFTTWAHVRWNTDNDGRVTAVYFDDASRNRLASTEFAVPRFLGHTAKSIS